ncbi:uncharacterized protein LOC110708442 [Chenopodium quinoa]|uniref:uncharacterized protein LOC110708442 n=1 Tax=Chenopodium quinoa TaxID=63459 RepID=UPI000B77D474|nr:uncharacterized protein LOC110708442 [Chenopodium quinoa]
MEGYMDSSMFRAAVLGDTKVLEDAKLEEHKYLLKTPDLGNNIVHIAALRGHSTFIEKALARFPDLVREKNKKGNSPLHEAAKLDTINDIVSSDSDSDSDNTSTNTSVINVIISHLSKDKDGVSSGSTSGNTSTNTSVPYLCEVNNDRDTPFHSALRSRNMAAAEALFAYVKAQPQLLLITNNFGETPLHLYVRYCAGAIFPEDLEHDENNNAVGKLKFIDEMINANPLAIFEHDLQGMNPLMRAAQYGRVLVVHQILANHTHSIECRDRNGRNFLHHLRLRMADFNASDKGHTLWMCEKILEITGVDALIVSCDQDGNTPLHKAILDREFDLAYLILQSCADYITGRATTYSMARLIKRKDLILSLKNDDGKTIIDLITSGSDIPANLKNMMDRLNTGRITNNDQYGFVLQHNGDKYINDLISEGNGSNVIYIALHHGKAEYFERALSRYPNMIYQKDSNGDTPLHIGARVPSDVAREVVKKSLKHWIDKNRQSLSIPPWRVKNSRGNTIFHEAVRSSNYELLHWETETDPDLQEALLDINESGETVLHLLAKYCNRFNGDSVVHGNEIIYKSGFAAYMRDVDGFAPILRAAHSGQTLVAFWIYNFFPTSIRMSDW